MSYEQKSPWAIIIIIIVSLLAFIFWTKQKPDTSDVFVVPAPNQKEQSSNANLNIDNLEASIGSIEIPEYSE